MDKLDQAIAALKAENKRWEQEPRQVRTAITALQGVNNNGHGLRIFSRWAKQCCRTGRLLVTSITLIGFGSASQKTEL
jgi:hypothetical protein